MDHMEFLSACQTTPDMLGDLTVWEKLENSRLQQALHLLKERELYILYAKVIDNRSFVDIAAELDLGYKAVPAIYYRMMAKIKAALEVNTNEF